MKYFPKILVALPLLLAALLASAAGNCEIQLTANDAMQYNTKTATVSASCTKITIKLGHSGKMAANIMGHNVVIARSGDVSAQASSAIKAGAASGYVPKGDAKVIAATPLIGGGANTTASFAGNKLQAGGDYSFFCSFPGHSGMMKGKLIVTK